MSLQKASSLVNIEDEKHKINSLLEKVKAAKQVTKFAINKQKNAMSRVFGNTSTSSPSLNESNIIQTYLPFNYSMKECLYLILGGCFIISSLMLISCFVPQKYLLIFIIFVCLILLIVVCYIVYVYHRVQDDMKPDLSRLKKKRS